VSLGISVTVLPVCHAAGGYHSCMSEMEHDPAGEVWERHAAGDKRSRLRDAQVREDMRKEELGEYDADGVFRRSTWTDASGGAGPDDE